MPDFAAFTPGRAVLGPIGGASTVDRGNQLISEHGVADPAGAIAGALAQELSQRLALTLASHTVQLDTDEVAPLAKTFPDADLLLDVRTINWLYGYFPTAWNRYWVLYTARVRLVDVKRGQVLAEGVCSRKAPEDSSNARSEEELLANSAQHLKAELANAAQFCLQRFRSATFAFAGDAPSIAAAQQPALAAVALPAAVAASPARSSGGRMPQTGDAWTYRLSEPKRADGPKQRAYRVKVTAADAGGIVEHYAVDGGAAGEWTHKGERELLGLGKSVFAPYLLAFGEPPNSLGRPQARDCGLSYICEASARVIGWEKVKVPAGEFNALKIEVRQEWRPVAMMGPQGAQLQGGRNLHVWYAPEAKRAVKFSSRATFGDIPPIDPDFDLELAEYRLN